MTPKMLCNHNETYCPLGNNHPFFGISVMFSYLKQQPWICKRQLKVENQGSWCYHKKDKGSYD